MKRLLLIILPLTALCSCNSDQSGQNDKRLNQSPALIQQFKPVINGVWVKKDYIKKVKKSKSPLEAIEKSKGITAMYIDTAKLKSSSISIPVVRNNHEGENLTLKFESGRNTTTIILGNDELSYKIKNHDTTLIIYQYDSKTNETSSAQYIKVPDNGQVNGPSQGMKYMINQALLSGTYEGKDANGKPVKAIFFADGKVTGLDRLNTYLVQNDMIANPDRSHDEIIFNPDSKEKKSYSFIIHKKTLNLYDDSEHIQSNKPSYTLKKKRGD